MYQKSWSYAVLFLSAFLPPNSLKNQNFKKTKKVPADINIFHMCTKDDD